MTCSPLDSGATVVDALYTNFVGSSAPQSVLDEYGAMLDCGSMTATALGIAVADHSLNATNIYLVGLIQTGVEYIPYGWLIPQSNAYPLALLT